MQQDDEILDRTVRKNVPYDGPGKLTGSSHLRHGGHYELLVQDHFDAAHALPGYDGPCQYLHGHTWDVEVVVIGQHLDEVGMLYDFKDIKRDLHAVLENFDHRCINDVPPFDVISPTAEHLSRVVFYELEKTLPAHISLKEVGIWESPLAKVTYRP
ncbi:MAG: 6-carboxytetrahydropterin synthase QueD [Gordonibacter sp.]|uniref:6-carboxytetrahydropterin synthase QueD n=1 Tax=Gordonibacter sp. TaxID=1968902 RepID=UPI002FC5C47B